MAQAKLDALLHGGPQALLCLLRPTVCPSWCPSPTDSHSSCGHPSIQVAPCPLPTRDNPWPRFSLMTPSPRLFWVGRGPRGRLVCPNCFLGAQKQDSGDTGGCWALRSGCFWVWDEPPLPPGACSLSNSGNRRTHQTDPIPGSAASLLTFALRILKTDLWEMACESHTDGVLWNFHETSFCPVLSKLLINPCYHHPTSRLGG